MVTKMAPQSETGTSKNPLSLARGEGGGRGKNIFSMAVNSDRGLFAKQGRLTALIINLLTGKTLVYRDNIVNFRPGDLPIPQSGIFDYMKSVTYFND